MYSYLQELLADYNIKMFYNYIIFKLWVLPGGHYLTIIEEKYYGYQERKTVMIPIEIAEHFRFTLPAVSIQRRILNEAGWGSREKTGEKQTLFIKQKEIP